MDILDEIETAIPALRRYAHALERDRDAADDLVQDTLERALSRRAQWRGEGSVRAWLFGILQNRYRDTLRRAGPRLVTVEDLATEPARPGAQEGQMALREVHDAMGRLPADQRAALLLVALEGMSFDEAARVLGLPRGTLMSRLARARAALRGLTGRDEPRKVTR
ncbi:MAG: sigma-70 family RNA polymerase sigma factor [Paracoccaceae bacterium]|nr:sigma-70 family RNA polymerase sigma factor [Paracoccaceae bacterium]MDE3238471.1 sigma-70 family RNA polymerase sigma factor [Paracoccaceae bacterium]